MEPAQSNSNGNGGYGPYEQIAMQEVGLGRYWHILWSRKALIAVITFLGVLTGLLSTLSQTPMYEARTTLEVQALNDNFLNIQAYSPTVTPNGYALDADVRTKMDILKSSSLIERVLSRLRDDDQIRQPAERLQPSWRDYLGLPVGPELTERERAISQAAGNLSVRLVGATRLIEAVTSSTDPNLAADFLNLLAEQFIEQHIEAHWETTQRTSEFLSRQLDDLKIKLEQAEETLRNYAAEVGLSFISENNSAAEAKLRQIQDELSRVQADRIAKQSRYETATSGVPERLADIVSEGSLSGYNSQLTALRSQRAELTATLTEKHPRVLRIDAQIGELESALERERSLVIDRIRDDYETALRREELLLADYSAQSALVREQAEKLSHYSLLKHEVDTTRDLYDTLLQRVQEGGIVAAMRASNIRVVDPAKAPSSPYRPNIYHNGLLGAMFGLFGGVVVVFMRELGNRKIHSPGEIESYLNTRELGVIPASSAIKNGNLVRQLQGPLWCATGDDPNGNGGWQVAPIARPSLLAESFRDTLASLLLSQTGDERPQVVVLTSPNPGEGKTTVACNLAAALAEIGGEILLIDADLRKPQVHEIFGVPNERGLSDLLEDGQWTVEESLRGYSSGFAHLHLLLAGRKAPGSSSVFYSQRMAALITELRLRYSTILIDTPPMLHLPDARILARLSDGVILVVRAGKTGGETVRSVTRRLSQDGTMILGTVLNRWDPSRSGDYGYKYGPWFRHYKKYYPDEFNESDSRT